MTTTVDIDPDHGAPDPALDAQAAASPGALFKASPSIAADLEEAGRAHARLRQERRWTGPLRALREWPLTAGAPAGVSQANGNAALERALRALFGQ
jgi:hypothetical protein